MKESKAPKLTQLPRVCVRLDKLVLPDGLTLPRVERLPKASQQAYDYLSVVLAAQAPVVSRPDTDGQRRVVANANTLALVRALVPQTRKPAFRVECWEVQADVDAAFYVDFPKEILDLMVPAVRPPPERELLRKLRADHDLALRRRKDEGLSELVSKGAGR